MTSRNPLGVQLYSVRNDLGPGKLDHTLLRLAGMGFTHVEPYDILSDTAALKSAMDSSGLKARTAHAKITELDHDAVLAAAAELGIDTVIVPWVDPAGITDRAGVEKLAGEINQAARYAAGFGVRVGYHNHDFEFALRIDGQSAYELLVSLLADQVVLQVDTYWASVGGANVFELLPRLGRRVRFLHVKNEPRRDDDPPVLGVDIAGRMAEVLRISRDSVEMPVVEVVVDDGEDIFAALERNAVFFLNEVHE
jgi:sugar phosphate isomerase/epimerase